MCGIAGVHRLSDRPFPELDRFCAALLDGIEPRGQDATGFVAVDDIGSVQLQKASCRAFFFNQHRGQVNANARTVLLHTRWATQGKPAFPENNHPVHSGGVYCVHNGHISNDVALFALAGRERAGQVDSEAIPALVASKGWDTIPGCFEDIAGDFAIALVSPKHPGDLVLAKGNMSPLVIVQTDHLLVWASTREAIVKAWETALGTAPGFNRFEYMNRGDALIVHRNESKRVRFKVKEKEFSYWVPKRDGSQTIASAYADGAACATPSRGSTASVRAQYPALSETEAEIFANLVGASDGLDELEAGTDIGRCEDCNEWVDITELETVNAYGITCDLCWACAVWARSNGLVVEGTDA